MGFITSILETVYNLVMSILVSTGVLESYAPFPKA